MKERPILFSGAMVKAILNGSKGQTRRVVKNQHLPGAPSSFNAYELEDGRFGFSSDDEDFICPYGRPGDQLWVREKFCLGAVVCGDSVEGEVAPEYIEQCLGQDNAIPYQWAISQGIGIEDVKWKPSIFMFRKDSRINLEITDIKVERLNDISGHDVLSEGVDNGKSNPTMGERWENMQKMAFQTLWDSINGKPKLNKPDYSWSANPYVWVVEFKKI